MHLQPADGADTELARLLHRAQRVDLSTLLRLLSMARAHRGVGVTLADLLRERGLLGDEELERLLLSSSGEQVPEDPHATKPHHEVLSPRRDPSDAEPDAEATQLRPPRPPRSDLEHSLERSSELERSAGLEDSAERGPQRGRLQLGSRIGSYLLREKLGAGGMGVVYLAEHLGTGARVALKTVLPALADEEVCARLRREGQAQALVSAHPNVARVYEQGEQDGLPYLTMELVAGGDLKQRLRGGALEPGAAAELALGIARGLAHMHEAGVLHRDLKPGNVLLDEGGAPKLVDFGLARFDGATTLTQSGTVMGTPLYMAPEQALGYRSEIGPPTDVYALGAILYELLTGLPPFTGASSSEVIVNALSLEAESPASRRPEVPLELSDLCLSLLAKDPLERPTAAAAAEALRATLVPGAGLGRARGLAASWRRVPPMAWALVAFGVVTLALGLGLLVSVRQTLAEVRAAQASPAPAASPSPAPSAQPSPGASAQPSPADPHPREATPAFGLAVGDARRLVFSATLRSSGPQAQDPSRQKVQSFEYSLRLELRWVVERVDRELARGQATLERLGVQYSIAPPVAMLPPLDFDSERPARADERYRAALGKSFALQFAARTGQPTVEGIGALQEAIWSGLTDRMQQQLHRVPFFAEEGLFAATLGALCVALPDPPERAGWSRDLAPLELLGRQRAAGGVLQPPPPAPLKAAFKAAREPELQVTWGGAYDREVATGNTYESKGATFDLQARIARELRGTCALEGGFFRRATLSDTTRAQLVFTRPGAEPQTPVAPTKVATTLALEVTDS
ncbi:MAG: serine/threonine-protein kinase [Planctomycetota bacterium]